MMSSAFIWALLSVTSSIAAKFKGLERFDVKNFMCHHFESLCENILDEINCSHESAARVIEGCPNYPNTLNNVSHWIGTCQCNYPVPYTDSGAITRQLISNRLVPDVSWMLEPWSTGPPYDIQLSYTNICQKFLKRIHCPKDAQENYALDYLPTVDAGSNFQCACGKLSATTEVNKLIADKLNDYHLKTTPIFSNPVYLSVPVSMCIVLLCGKMGAILAVYLKLPPIIGFLLAGMGLQNVLNPMFLKGAGYPFPSPASELKLIALVIVLMRAGLAVKLEELYQYAWPTALLSLLPYLGEFFVFMYVGAVVFGYPVIDMGLFASVMAPLGPSVVISALLTMVADQKRDHGYAPKQVLISAPIEAVIAIILFGIFYTLNQTDVPPLYPWVKILPLYANCLLIPVNLLFSTVMGIVVGWACSRYINYRIKLKTDFIWVRISKNPQMGSSTADLVFVLLVAAYTMMSLCNQQYIQRSSGVLVVFVMSITASRLIDPVTATDIAQGLKGIWIFAEVFLFTLTGTSLSFDSTNGPLYGQRGLDGPAVAKVMSVMVAGTAGRLVSLAISVAAIAPTFPKHRRQMGWIVPFYVNLFIFQLPKATVQATLGSVAYTTRAIPGAAGVNRGLFIAQCTAFTVLVYAPLGGILTKFVGGPISVYLERLDQQNNWNSSRNHISRKATSHDVTRAAIPDEESATELKENAPDSSDEEEMVEEQRIAAAVAAHPREEELAEPEDLIDVILHRTFSKSLDGNSEVPSLMSRVVSFRKPDDQYSNHSSSVGSDPQKAPPLSVELDYDTDNI